MRDKLRLPHDEIPVRDYIHITYSKIALLEGNPKSEGATLADGCLNGLKLIENPKRFPPRLLILLTSPEYLELEKAEQILAGIHETFARKNPDGEVPLIGSSVSAIFCDKQIYPKGALLICLASGLIKGSVGVGENARQNPQGAIKDLLLALELNPERKVDPNPLANRMLLSFMPGFKKKEGEEYYPAPALHRLLREAVQTRIRLVGGVSSSGDLELANDGLLYAGRRVFKDAVVAVNIEAGTPIAVNLSYGFEPTNKIIQVKTVGDNQRSILAFDKGTPAGLVNKEGKNKEGKNIVLLKFLTDGEPSVDLPRLSTDRKKIRLLHKVEPGDSFRVGSPNKKKILQQFEERFDQSRERVLINKPIICLTLAGRTWNNCFQTVFDFRDVLKFVEEKRRPCTCIGGFFDGELGVDESGRSLFFNGASSNLIFGDEMRERTPSYQGVAALLKYGPSLKDPSVEGFIKNALKIVVKTGFPGAMISLIQPDQSGDYIIAQDAKGKRVEEIMQETRCPLDSEHPLAKVAKGDSPRFIPDCRKLADCDAAMAVGKVVSQYILPLRRLDKEVLGVLQVDLGELHHQEPDGFETTQKAIIINSLAEFFGAGLSQLGDNKEKEIILELDKTFNESLSAARVEAGLQRFIDAASTTIGAEMAHLRLIPPKDELAGDSEEQTWRLVAGRGPLHEAGQTARRVISCKDVSLIRQVFDRKDVVIINDLDGNGDYKAVCQAVADNAELADAYKQMKSYAAIAFRNESGTELGALSLASTKPWFFKAYHRRIIESLAQRVALLVEHLQARSRLQFLFDVSTKLAEIDLDKISQVLEETLGRFCQAIHAEFSSLYLWDKGKKKFVLRAQYGWKKPEWVDAASYGFGDTWFALQAFKTRPKYIGNTYKYYKEEYNPDPDRPGGYYSKQMFGAHFSESFTFEAIGIPLKIGKKEKRFGILTLYRQIKPGEASGFLTTNMKLLEEGAYKMSGLVNALQEHRKDTWQNNMQDRHQELYEAVTEAEKGEDFVAEVCQKILKIYEAVQVQFYKVDDSAGAAISWVAGYDRSAGANKVKELGKVEPDKEVKRAVTNVLNGKKEAEKIVLQRHEVSDAERKIPKNPKLLATDGLVERACLPILSAQQLVGVLDLRWQVTHRDASLMKAPADFNYLGRIGHIFGGAYIRHQLSRENEKSKLAVQATGAYVFQRAHRIINAVRNIKALAKALETTNKVSRERIIKDLKAEIDRSFNTINWTIDLGQRVQNPAQEKIPVVEVIRKSFDDLEKVNYHLLEFIRTDVAPDLVVMAAPELLKEIFANLINNAFNAMKAVKRPILKITAVPCPNKKVEIIFEDNGVGMTKAEIEDAERGFVSKGDHKGVGVLISRVLAQVQGGTLRFDSKKHKGTKAIVTLAGG